MRSNRRLFLKQSSLAVAACSLKMGHKITLNASFAHHALFWLKDKDKHNNYNAALAALKEFGKIKEVKFLHVGAPSVSDIDYEAQATDTTYTFSYIAFFESKKDKEKYLTDPLHTKFFNDFKDVVSKVIIYDSLSIS